MHAVCGTSTIASCVSLCTYISNKSNAQLFRVRHSLKAQYWDFWLNTNVLTSFVILGTDGLKYVYPLRVQKSFALKERYFGRNSCQRHGSSNKRLDHGSVTILWTPTASLHSKHSFQTIAHAHAENWDWRTLLREEIERNLWNMYEQKQWQQTQ